MGASWRIRAALQREAEGPFSSWPCRLRQCSRMSPDLLRSDLKKGECPGSAGVGKDRCFVKRDEFMAERSERRCRRDLEVRSEDAAPNERSDVGHWCKGATFEVRSDDE